MPDESVLILNGDDVSALLKGREAEIIDAVRRAYVAHGRGQSSLPHSSFLRFPADDRNRIIALPAFLGDGFSVAGLKWISSFPGNVREGIPRASAVLLLNSCENGHVQAILESSLISAKRTAASAALAASLLTEGQIPTRLGLIGTGVINFEIVRFLRVALPGISRVTLFDLDAARAGRFAERLRETGIGEVEVAPDLNAVLAACPLVSFATTASRPHVADLSACPPGATILHISLRDLAPQAILAADNVVDDADHVCRAQTSLHLAEQETGSRDFIRCTLAEVCEGTASPRSPRSPLSEAGAVAVFSPFGLGVLDLAVGQLAFDAALAGAKGTVIERFLPTEEGAV